MHSPIPNVFDLKLYQKKKEQHNTKLEQQALVLIGSFIFVWLDFMRCKYKHKIIIPPRIAAEIFSKL